MKKGLYYAFVLAVFCLVSAIALAWVYGITLKPIAEGEKKAVQESLKIVLPEAEEFAEATMNDAQKAKYTELYKDLAASENFAYYQGKKGGKIVGVVYSVFPKGYAGTLKMKVGIDSLGKVAGVKIIDQKETPGLGSRITDDNFQGTGKPFTAQYLGKSAKDPLVVKKDIQAITGATISSRGVTQGIKDALVIFSLGQAKGK